jgi:hypothetical protein
MKRESRALAPPGPSLRDGAPKRGGSGRQLKSYGWIRGGRRYESFGTGRRKTATADAIRLRSGQALRRVAPLDDSAGNGVGVESGSTEVAVRFHRLARRPKRWLYAAVRGARQKAIALYSGRRPSPIFPFVSPSSCERRRERPFADSSDPGGSRNGSTAIRW